MKVGYPDTINSGNSSATPFKMVDTSKADLDKDGKVSEYEGNRAEAAFGTPLNMKMPDTPEVEEKESTRSSDLIGQHRADNKIADFRHARKQADIMAKQKEAAIRKKQGTTSTPTSTPTSTAPKKKTKVGKAVSKIGKAVSKISKAVSNIGKNIKEKKTQRKAKKDFIAESKQYQTAYMKNKAADKKKKEDAKKNAEFIGKGKASPIAFANAAQRKAVWASKNEKKKKK